MWTKNRLILFAVAIAVLLVGTTLTAPSVSTPDPEPPDRKLVTLGESETTIWPYVGPKRSFDRRASSINLVVRADASEVTRRLRSGETIWNTSEPAFTEENRSERQVDNGTGVSWSDAYGAKRYVYYETGTQSVWTAQTSQLHHGDYFGGQYHVRVYDLQQAEGNWTVVQAHAEHWDWFTLTHTVDSLEEARINIEQDFMTAAGPDDVQRVYYDNGDTYDHDGWTTLVYFALLPLVGATAFVPTLERAFDRLWTRHTVWRVVLFLSIPAVVLAVRLGGVTAENLLTVDPDIVVAAFYPVLVIGTPLAAFAAGSRLEPTDGFLFGSLGFGMAVVVDYGFIGVSVLPIEVVMHRVGLAVAIGLVAAGARRLDDFELEPPLVVGLVTWLVLVVTAHVV
ncbi:hypothetical protein [Haloarchaeobius sp. TZWSO28]|uniref:hypothetical protein n=1 Tax=Haloarchaeobius sp. TZWSO28 TaxID=3446119 RepID=UPI003EB911DF